MDGSVRRIARSMVVWLTCISLAVYMLNPGRGQAGSSATAQSSSANTAG